MFPVFNSDLSKNSETEETLLLSTAALANLTFSHPEAVPLMAKYRTAQVLVRGLSLRKDLSIFIRDQVSKSIATHPIYTHMWRVDSKKGEGGLSYSCSSQFTNLGG